MELEQYTQIKGSIRKIFDINLDHYKDEQMRRRLDSWLVRSGAANWNDYFGRVRQDAKELARFRDYLTINVSSFFRDPERWEYLRANVMPALLQDLVRQNPARPGLRIWSAGCSIGPEPYSLAILLDELSPGRRHTITATDIDRGALAKARARGPYTADEVQNFSAAQRSAYLDAGGPPYFVKEALTRKIEFMEHNLFNDLAPGDQDLIICRNVVIYFTGEAKDFLYRKFYDALRPGGVLFVGATEIIPRSQDMGFRTFGISFYQKR